MSKKVLKLKTTITNSNSDVKRVYGLTRKCCLRCKASKVCHIPGFAIERVGELVRGVADENEIADMLADVIEVSEKEIGIMDIIEIVATTISYYGAELAQSVLTEITIHNLKEMVKTDRDGRLDILRQLLPPPRYDYIYQCYDEYEDDIDKETVKKIAQIKLGY